MNPKLLMVAALMVVPHPDMQKKPQNVNTSPPIYKAASHIPTAEDYWKPWDAWLKAKGSPISGADVWQASQATRIKGEVLICISGAETNYGKVAQRGSTTNVGSVASFDATSTTAPAGSIAEGLQMIGQTLDNPLLGHKTTIAQLSRKSEPYGPIYASSTENWERNLVNCLTEITGQPQTNQFQFRR